MVLGVEDDYPVFGHLKGIFVLNHNVHLYVQVAETKTFHEHYHAYVVRATNVFKTVPVHTLFNPWPLHCRKLYTEGHYKQMIVVKHHVLGTVTTI